MSLKNRIKQLENSTNKTEEIYVLWENDDGETYRDDKRDTIYTKSKLEDLRANDSNTILIAKWVK